MGWIQGWGNLLHALVQKNAVRKRHRVDTFLTQGNGLIWRNATTNIAMAFFTVVLFGVVFFA